MSFSSIRIHRDLPVANGYVIVPPVRERDKSRVTLGQALNTVAGSAEVGLSLGSGPNTGSKHGAQRFLRLPGLTPGQSYLTTFGRDPVAEFQE